MAIKQKYRIWKKMKKALKDSKQTIVVFNKKGKKNKQQQNT